MSLKIPSIPEDIDAMTASIRLTQALQRAGLRWDDLDFKEAISLDPETSCRLLIELARKKFLDVNAIMRSVNGIIKR